MNIDLLEISAIGEKCVNFLKLNGCYPGIKEQTRVTPTSEYLLDHTVHKYCLTKNEFGVIKTRITDQVATYVQFDTIKSQFIRLQQTKATAIFFKWVS